MPVKAQLYYMNNLFVISLGGSLIVPDEIDAQYLKKFRQLIGSQAKTGKRFIISPGGGKTCRRYQKALSGVVRPSRDDLDNIGLNTNRFHAVLLQLIFKRIVYPKIAYDPNVKLPFKEKILIGAGGWKPGRSSDDFSVRLAKIYGVATIINLSNINYVYNKDPRKHKDAKKITNISWKDFLKIIGTKWDPGANVPFDPTAAKFAQKHKLRLIITNGKNLKNLKNILNNKKFQGTIVGQ
jgi:uridylate kinase